jgi:hypothetical protein
MDQWLASSEIADFLGISRRCATKLLQRTADGKRWRGHELEVRQTFGRGGKSGLSYEVSLRSLSEALDDDLEIVLPQNREPRLNASAQGPVIAQRFKIIEPALAHDPRSSGRATAIAAQVKTTGVSERTLNRWIEAYEAEGFAGLGRRKPANAGKARIVVSQKFDKAFRAAGYQDELLEKISAEIKQAAKALWASRREASGEAAVRRDVETVLDMSAEKFGIALPLEAMKLSRRSVEQFSGYRVVNIYKNDRKRFDDTKPRIRRNWTGLQPMEMVVADVKPLDVSVMRPDGTVSYPRLIGFLDAGTCRLFIYPVLCAQGEGIRQEHVIDAFLAMVATPGWGFPRSLYLDNGSEFGALDKLKGALELLSEPGARTIVRARPYNASAKPIEAAFARLDLYVTCIIPGYAGAERMKKKTQTVGRPPVPYPHSWERFKSDFAEQLEDFNHKPTGGQWGGRSPMDWFQSKVDAGWRPIRADPLAIDASFCTFDERRVDRGVIKIKGMRYPVAGVPHGTIVPVALPWRRGGDPLFQRPGQTSWVYLDADLALPAVWEEGARESQKRQHANLRAVRQLAKDAGEIDALGLVKHRNRRRVQGVIPNPGPAFDPGNEMLSLAAGLATEGQAAAEVFSEAERVRRARDATTRRLNRAASRG